MPLTRRLQYEVDGSVETHNHDLPSTTSCPYMPGQSVNTLTVPVEQALRHRSASLSSMRPADFKTMNPESKFNAPRPAPSAPVENPSYRLGSSPLLNHKSSTRSLSPAPAWKRFFTRKLTSRDGERGRSPVRETNITPSDETDARCTTPSEGTRTRDISPESLRRFLSDDVPSRPGSNLSVRPTLVIPDEVTEDQDHDNDNDNDDDDNFATSAVSETQAYPTRLSPPPFRRTASCESVGAAVRSSPAALMLTKASTLPVYQTREVPASAVLPSRPRLETFASSRMNFTSAGYFTSPASQYADDEAQAYFDLTDDEDDVLSSNNSDIFLGQPIADASTKMESYECYSLPEPEERGGKIIEPQPGYGKMSSPALLSRGDSDLSVSGSNLLGSPINTGLDEFVSELGWMVEVIGKRD